MEFLFRLAGILASIAAFVLTVLDILQKHLGVDTQALLAGIGGGVGDAVAALAGWFGGVITALAELIRGIINPQPELAMSRCAPDEICARTAEVAQDNLQAFEFGAQAIIVVLALIVFFALARGRA